MPLFHASTVPLTGKNMIEASAGTGKTYSIALLTLRLILEKNIPLSEILMVTFTKAAVAELQDRIRLFVRTAAQAAAGEPIEDHTIAAIILHAQQTLSEKEVEVRLRNAVLQLDEIQVMTIHSFCQQALSEFAFESGQTFRQETLQNSNGLIDQAIQSFWRTHMAPLPLPILSLLPPIFNVSDARQAIQLRQSGKEFVTSFVDPGQLSFVDSIQYWHAQHQQIIQQTKDAWQQLVQAFRSHEEELLTALQKNTHAKKSIYVHYPDLEAMFEASHKKRETAYLKKIYQPIQHAFEAWCEQLQVEGEHLQELPERLYDGLLEYAQQFIRTYKESNQLMSFDDMIVYLHEALSGSRKELLIKKIGNKYKAVFIDEFQDTDKLQYQIFQQCFQQDQIIFYIGDPKQSIYAFRKADLHLYFQAVQDVDQVYHMNVNFRSSAALIESMNHFFEVEDPFHFSGEGETLPYTPVLSPQPNLKLTLHYQPNPDAALFLTETDDLAETAAARIHEVLSDSTWSAQKGGQAIQLKPADIGVLVRAGHEGHRMQKALQKRNIPAVLIADQTILASEEAKQLVYVLEALLNVDIQLIRRAMLQDFMQIQTPDLARLNDETLIELFSQIRTTALEQGIYQALHEWMRVFRVQDQLLREESTPAEKKLTNLRQLIELLHKEETKQHKDLAELIHWLKKGLEEASNEEDEYKQRIESDEQAVKIMTIHKSKGLEFPIVFLPFLESNSSKQGPFTVHRNPRTLQYEFVLNQRESEEQRHWHDQQQLQEDRRLLYVALTRGVAACFLFYKPRKESSKSSSFSPFLDHLLSQPHPRVQALETSPTMPAKWVNHERSQSVLRTRTASQFQLADANWRRVSYTALAAKHESIKRGKSISSHTDYDHFVFQQLSRGAQTGNLLHYLFENIDFTNDQHWSKVVTRAIRRHDPSKHDVYAEPLLHLLKQTLQSKIEVGGQIIDLQQISYTQRLQELEFDVLIKDLLPSELETLSRPDQEIQIQPYPRIQGILNGKIDLFFEQDGKYFILDWKSNYLGDTWSDYAPDKLVQAMNENNYHLQYLIYTTAAKKYLQTRLPDFDYERDFGGVIYIFLRGARIQSKTGIFTVKPPLESISAMEQWWHV